VAHTDALRLVGEERQVGLDRQLTTEVTVH
jgi:hypothetical protein